MHEGSPVGGDPRPCGAMHPMMESDIPNRHAIWTSGRVSAMNGGPVRPTVVHEGTHL
jgi:hypothetical protein